ncbi:D-galactarolactone cycloisomerase [Tistlia consotensis]|uniref:D-galactarolactone cycloisomerase n=1 Tax=Tistlia consotensis USBA 355 TaxID=560819 RepID=A0A1Y6BLB0_9PROT|nr:mandelate racemase/muconate lactonizing enzyme family protein [Tistlia consotensis]SMF06952.1 D-galactarolactone cycloisomerase [Tistlia consotensis USBA 355]SNR36185.1 D-galactarolactone cycloisomerase [Tistlia consotensis]
MADPAHQVVKVEGFEVTCRLPRPVGNSMRTFDRRSSLIVRITTRSGAVGWGETWAFPEAAGSLIRSNLAPAILGADATAPRTVQARMVAPLAIDRRGQCHMAISALDIALWDAWGRIAGQPIHALLGGALRDRVPAYASGPFLEAAPDRYGALAGEVERYAAAGFRAIKLRVGTDLATDASAIRQARSILGAEALLMADLNEGSTVRDAVALTEAVADARLSWIEEPIPHDDLPGYRRLAQLLSLPLAGGESFSGTQAFRDFLAAGALDIVQPDLAICGGLTEGLRVAALADAFETAVAPHVWGTGINFLASLQFAAVLTPRRGPVPFPLFEYDMGINPLRSALYDPQPDRDGRLAVPDGPGLGIEISIDRLADYVTGHWTLE